MLQGVAGAGIPLVTESYPTIPVLVLLDGHDSGQFSELQVSLELSDTDCFEDVRFPVPQQRGDRRKSRGRIAVRRKLAQNGDQVFKIVLRVRP